MGICSHDADLDLVCVVPAPLTRVQFFTAFKVKLHKDGTSDHQSINAIDVRAPFIGFKYREIDVDLAVAIINPVADLDFDNPDVLSEAVDSKDEANIAALNAIAARNYVFRITAGTPTCDNPVFHDLFQFVRIWAKGRGVYGVLNGTACQLLAAHVVRKYPEERRRKGFVGSKTSIRNSKASGRATKWS
jgi:poly(A) polymerase Pap1